MEVVLHMTLDPDGYYVTISAINPA